MATRNEEEGGSRLWRGMRHLIFGAEAEPIINEPAVRIANLSGVNLNVRNIAAMELPAQLFDKRQFKAGDVIEFSSTLLTHCHAYRVEWRGKFKLQH